MTAGEYMAQLVAERAAFYAAERVALYLGDCIEVMAAMPEASVDAIVTDPPYGLEFMGKDWDAPWKGDTRQPGDANYCVPDNPYGRAKVRYGGTAAYGSGPAAMRGFQEWCETWARAALRVLKPGGHLVAFGGPRTVHRLTCGLEDAGFEIRDLLMWLFGQGFPKGLNVERAIAEAICPLPGRHFWRALPLENKREPGDHVCPVTPESELWAGWSVAPKPAYEPIVLARKPLAGTVAQNVLTHGTGALNIDATRLARSPDDRFDYGVSGDEPAPPHQSAYAPIARSAYEPHGGGRWPANVLLDEEAAALLDAQAGRSTSRIGTPRSGANGGGWGMTATGAEYDDRGGASRFFYTTKATRSEREAGLEDLEPERRTDGRAKDIENPRLRTSERRNDHPTVKPLDLMRWLCRLVTPPGGLILDPFLGAGTTAMAALDEDFACIGIEREAHYLRLARRRIAHRHLLADGQHDTAQRTGRPQQGRML